MATTSSTYETPASATSGDTETGAQKAASCSVISRGATDDAAVCSGVAIGGAASWTFTKVAPVA